METKKCSKCQADIPIKATLCPNCKSDLRSWSRRHPMLTILGILFGVPIFLGIATSSSDDSISEQVTPIISTEELEKWKTAPAGKLCVEHPEWQKEDCDKLIEKTVWIGMHYDMLTYLRGKPDSTNPSNYGRGTQYQYCWHDRTPSCFYDKNNDNLMDAFN